ncbi:hypothetical protein BGW38_002027 [Lunasporangiospora selenospora]|uniref:Mif2/CENP-C cupin domain-containing protein n=1 Tax=Lunasporangiospora selenospora TaxID=979761 RepID=A0A9P6KDV7_9FUNG|nr:hypothetical protein BGW38_002027 [Lunasporangiospora selenospora]
MKANIKKDADGLDNIDDFWDDGNDETRKSLGGSSRRRPPSSTPPPFENRLRETSPRSEERREMHRQLYYGQELPEELLTTPTSRRTRVVGMSRESDGTSIDRDDRSYHHEMEEYRSPSFHSVKKRLVFTADENSEGELDSRFSSALSGQRPPAFSSSSAQPRPGTGSVLKSPALDKLLSDSRQKMAKIAESSSRANLWSLTLPPSIAAAAAAKSTLTSSTSTLGTISVPKPTSKPTSKPTPKPTGTISGATASSSAGAGKGTKLQERPNQPLAARPVKTGRHSIANDPSKAFDFATLDDDDDDHYDDAQHDEEPYSSVQDQDYDVDMADAREMTPPPAAIRSKPASHRTPAEFRRKKVIEDAVHTELPSLDQLRFSDEDEGPSYGGAEQELEEEEEEYEEQLEGPRQDRQGEIKYPVQLKRSTKSKEPATTTRRGKKVAEVDPSSSDIPKTTKAVRRAGRGAGTGRTKDGEEERDEGERAVPRSKGQASAVTRRGRRKKKVLDDSDMDEEESSSGGRSRAKIVNEPVRHHERPAKLVVQEVPTVPDVGENDDNGIRRSRRTRMAPLEFWKNEKVVLGKVEEDQPGSMPGIKAIIRATAVATSGHGSSTIVRKRQRARVAEVKQRSRQVKQRKKLREGANRSGDDHGASDGVDSEIEENANDTETELLEAQEKHGLKEESSIKTVDTAVFGSNMVVPRAVIESKDAVRLKEVQGREYLFHRGLEDEENMVSGTMRITPSGEKPVSSGSSNTLTEFVISTGGRFMIPRGNQYSLTNVSTKRDCHLFFVQVKAQAIFSEVVAPAERLTEIAATGETGGADSAGDGHRRRKSGSGR